jgi:hypothetical protein
VRDTIEDFAAQHQCFPGVLGITLELAESPRRSEPFCYLRLLVHAMVAAEEGSEGTPALLKAITV